MPGHIPQTDVDSRDGFEPETGGVAAHTHGRIHALPVQAYFEWILPDDQRREEILDDPRGRFRTHGCFGLTPADATGLRFQADQYAVQGLSVDVFATCLGWIVHR